MQLSLTTEHATPFQLALQMPQQSGSSIYNVGAVNSLYI